MAGKRRAERNHFDERYLKALEDYEKEINTAITETALRQIALKQVLTEKDKAEVAALRELYSDCPDDLPKNDKICWLFHVAIGDDQDVVLIANAATRQAQPTAEAIEQYKNGFPGDEGGQGHLEMSHPQERD